jgi:hypothetical protein
VFIALDNNSNQDVFQFLTSYINAVSELAYCSHTNNAGIHHLCTVNAVLAQYELYHSSIIYLIVQADNVCQLSSRYCHPAAAQSVCAINNASVINVTGFQFLHTLDANVDQNALFQAHNAHNTHLSAFLYIHLIADENGLIPQNDCKPCHC